MLRKNQLTLNQATQLRLAIKSFLEDSKQQFDTEKFVTSTINNICLGLDKKASHDLWVAGYSTISAYCLGKPEIDADGEKVYTAYQLWIAPKQRSLKTVHRIIKFLRFYAQKQGYKRLYVISSRLDKLAAYSRGLGKNFKQQTAVFKEDYNAFSR